MTNEKQTQSFADEIGVDANAVAWLVDYIARQTPEGHEDLLTDPNWIAACVEDWRKMAKRMTADALRNPEAVGKIVLATMRNEE